MIDFEKVPFKWLVYLVLPVLTGGVLFFGTRIFPLEVRVEHLEKAVPEIHEVRRDQLELMKVIYHELGRREEASRVEKRIRELPPEPAPPKEESK